MAAQPLPDLVRDSKIETVVLSDKRTRHVIFRAGRSARQRRVRIEETWARAGCLGRGAYGTVYKEYREAQENPDEDARRPEGEARPTVRAVKKINKAVISGEEIDYAMELETIAKFSNPKYSHCFVRSDGWYEVDDSVFHHHGIPRTRRSTTASQQPLAVGRSQRHFFAGTRRARAYAWEWLRPPGSKTEQHHGC